MNKAELDFYTECAARQGLTLDELTKQDDLFWSGDDGNV